MQRQGTIGEGTEMKNNGLTMTTGFYYTLHACLKRAIESEELSCHADSIIVELAKSIESRQTYYNAGMDVWCDYFLRTTAPADEEETP